MHACHTRTTLSIATCSHVCKPSRSPHPQGTRHAPNHPPALPVDPQPAVWAAHECMLHNVKISQFVNQSAAQQSQRGVQEVEAAVFLATPFDWSLTHFLDRASHLLAQVGGRPRSSG